MEKVSNRWSLIAMDWKKIWKGFLISLGGLVCAYLANLSGLVDFSKYGDIGPVVAIGVSFVASNLINVINKWIGKTTYQPEV